MTILALDPGSERTGWLLFHDSKPEARGWDPNADVLEQVRDACEGYLRDVEFRSVPVLERVLIETIEPWSGFTGPPALETMRWVGRFEEAAHPIPVELVKRSAVLRALGIGKVPKGQAQSAVRALLMDRYGSVNPVRKADPLHGISSHLWSCLALAVAWSDR